LVGANIQAIHYTKIMIRTPHLRLILLFVFIQIHSFAQDRGWTKIEKDCKCPEFDKSKYFSELKDISESANEIEIRLVQHSMINSQYSMISFNNGKYDAVYYVTKLNTFHTIEELKKLKNKSPYYRYTINNKDLKPIMDELIKDSVFSWVDPGVINYNITDLGIMIMYYKYGNTSGSYKFQPPYALLSVQPNSNALKRLSRLTNQIYYMTDSVRLLFRNQKPIK
jgi:hypothetical protein